MAKKSKRRKKHKRSGDIEANIPPGGFTPWDVIYPMGFTWMDEEGLHALLPGEAPPEEFFQLLTENFQKELRNSPLWQEMVCKIAC